MSLIRGKHTSPELVVRRLVSSLGFRYGLHARTLPGRPDLTFKKDKKAIFVHGCFWHQHKRCKHYKMPQTRLDFWLPKLEGNRSRDQRNLRRLRGLGWKTLVLWECQLKKKKLGPLQEKIRGFLE